MIRCLLVIAITLSATAAFAEKRCGWLANPTPANWWLTDRDGEWILSTQGRAPVAGFDDLPDMSTKGWVVTNGSSYGYGCACIDLTTDRAAKTVLRMGKATPIPLAACRKDPSLPKRGG
jgi:Protein of unknown function (DUF4087)